MILYKNTHAKSMNKQEQQADEKIMEAIRTLKSVSMIRPRIPRLTSPPDAKEAC